MILAGCAGFHGSCVRWKEVVYVNRPTLLRVGLVVGRTYNVDVARVYPKVHFGFVARTFCKRFSNTINALLSNFAVVVEVIEFIKLQLLCQRSSLIPKVRKWLQNGKYGYCEFRTGSYVA